jgi:hypothetical protein
MHATHFVRATLAAAALALAMPAQGCPIGDDGFAIGCCTPVNNVNLPFFPPFQVQGVYCCLKDCDLEQRFPIVVSTQHFPIFCDAHAISVTVTPSPPPGPGWSGVVIAKYSRTWIETPVAGLQRQVWRFLLNGDFSPTAGVSPCPLPPHGTQSHFTGHIDYACEIDAAGNQVVRMALNLNHWPGCISHNAISAAPLTGAAAHADRSYHINAPATFSCQPTQASNGTIPAEAVRSTIFPAGYVCLGEGDVLQGNIFTVSSNWLCQTPSGGPFAYRHQNFVGSVGCAGLASPWAPLPTSLPLPPLPTGFTTLGLGSWIGPPDVFPGTRELLIHWGILQYPDACNPNDLPLHFVTGATTRGPLGTLFSQPAGPFREFLDLQNMIHTQGLFGPWTLGFGRLFLPKIVWNVNLP